MEHTYDNDKLKACLRKIFSEFLDTGCTSGKAIYIFDDGTYDVRPQCQVSEDTVDYICVDNYLERELVSLPWLSKIKELRDNSWQNEHVEEDVARVQDKMFKRLNVDRDWMVDTFADSVCVDLVEANDEYYED